MLIPVAGFIPLNMVGLLLKVGDFAFSRFDTLLDANGLLGFPLDGCPFD